VIQFLPKYNLHRFMGWYFRKSVGFGPFRVNLSKSGIGASVGVRGARIGLGPRGHYVRLGRGGLYYQQYFHPAREGPQSQTTKPTVHPLTITEPEVPIATVDVSHLQDSTAEGLLKELREKERKIRFAPISATAFVIATILLLGAQLSLWVIIPCIVLFVFVHAAMVRSDYERKLAVLDYDLDSEARVRYVTLLNALRALASSARIWRVSGAHRSADMKYTAGADTLMDKKPVSVRLAAPNFVQTRVAVWEIALGNQKLYFFPDRILIYQGSGVGAVQYLNLSVELQHTGFVETDGVPSDSEVIGQTWRYVNKKGGPDRRFANNPQIPIVRYGQLTITSSSGVNFVLQCSSTARAAEFESGLRGYVAPTVPE
jgi:hypothetical protein